MLESHIDVMGVHDRVVPKCDPKGSYVPLYSLLMIAEYVDQIGPVVFYSSILLVLRSFFHVKSLSLFTLLQIFALSFGLSPSCTYVFDRVPASFHIAVAHISHPAATSGALCKLFRSHIGVYLCDHL